LVKHAEAKRCFVLLPRHWVLERSFGRAGCFRRLARYYERRPQMLDGLHFIAVAVLMLARPAPLTMGLY
jgi:transposase